MTLFNEGKFDCIFDWRMFVPPKLRKDPPIVSCSPETGTVKAGSRAYCDVAFCPPYKINLSDVSAVCNIKNGPAFPVTLIGAGILPDLHFSFKKHDFGPCFLHQPGMQHEKAVLSIVNQDIRDIR